jgi:hypothetical protein
MKTTITKIAHLKAGTTAATEQAPEGFERVALGTFETLQIEDATYNIEALARTVHRMSSHGEEDNFTFDDIQRVMMVVEREARDLREILTGGKQDVDEQLARQSLAFRSSLRGKAGAES